MNKPNTWLLATAKFYPGIADELKEVADYIDTLRSEKGELKRAIADMIDRGNSAVDHDLMGYTPTPETSPSADQNISSPNLMKCGHCGHEGYAYGAATGNGVSAPWCSNCGKNDALLIASVERSCQTCAHIVGNEDRDALCGHTCTTELEYWEHQTSGNCDKGDS